MVDDTGGYPHQFPSNPHGYSQFFLRINGSYIPVVLSPLININYIPIGG